MIQGPKRIERRLSRVIEGLGNADVVSGGVRGRNHRSEEAALEAHASGTK